MKARLSYGDGRPCPDEVARAVLETFIATFVQSRFRERALILLVDRPKRRREAVHALARWVDARCQTRLRGQDTFPQVLAERHGNPEGIYHNERGSLYLPLDVAATRGNLDDALFTVMPGLAFVFEEMSVTRLDRLRSRRS